MFQNLLLVFQNYIQDVLGIRIHLTIPFLPFISFDSLYNNVIINNLFLNKVTSDLSLENNEKTIHKLIHGIFELNQNDDVFGDYRCVGDCYSTEQSVKIELDDETVSKIKDIFQKYDFDDYDSEEEEISKIIRSMINFADEEEGIKTIFSS